MKVSVVITSYNHEKYISQAIESVLMQKVDELEIIIGDDCSTDRTPEILDKYKKRYPDKIVILKDDKNLGITKNLERCIKRTTGRFVAICEGDDYWIDDEKLQKQVDFLVSNKDCAMCFNKINLYYQDEDKFLIHPSQQRIKANTVFGTRDLIYDNFIGNFSCCMYRKDLIESLSEDIFNFYTVDWMFNMAVSEFGKIGFIDEVMSVYRIHGGGAWSGIKEEKKLLSWIKYIDVYNQFFKKKYNNEFIQLKKRIYGILFGISLKEIQTKKMIFYGYKSGFLNLVKNSQIIISKTIKKLTHVIRIRNA